VSSKNSIVDLDEIFKDDETSVDTSVIDNQQNQIKDIEEVFTESPAPSSDEALATFVYGDPSMPIGEGSLDEPDLRGKIAAADTRNEKIAEFKARYPEGELIFVPGKGTAESTLEGVPSKYSGGEILFRRNPGEDFTRLDSNFFKGGGNEFLSDFAEFVYDDAGVIFGEILAGSKKFAKFVSPFTKGVPFLGTVTTGFELLPLMTRMAIYGAGGEFIQEGIQELRGINEQTFSEIADTAAFKGLVSFVGTGVAEPVVRKLGDIFTGKGMFKKTDEAGNAQRAVGRINEILRELKIYNNQGEILQISPLPANLLVDNQIIQRIGKQTAATGGLLSGQYREINEALSQALKGVGDVDSANKLISLLNVATQLEKTRLIDLAHSAKTGSFKFEALSKEVQESVLQKFGIKSIDELPNVPKGDISEILIESVQRMTEPGGQLDLALTEAYKSLNKLKPDGIKFDLSNVKELATKEAFGKVQLAKQLDGSSDDLAEIIINDLGQERLDVLDTQISRIIGQLDNPSADRIERITAREYRKFLTQRIGSDPLIDIRANNSVIQNIAESIRNIEGDGGVIQLPEGAGGGSVDIFDFLLDARNQLMEIRFSPIGQATRSQRQAANDLLQSIDKTLKNPSNADSAWGQAYKQVMNLQDEQVKIMNLPLVIAANNEGNYAQLLKGYVLPQHTKKDIDLIFSVLDDKGKIAFKQGLVNQLIGNTDKVKNLYKNFNEFDKETLEYVLDTATYRSLEQIAEFSRKMADSNINKILDTQVKFGKAIDVFMSNNNTKGINDALEFIANYSVKEGDKTLTGFNTPLGKAFHEGIINRLFTKAVFKDKGKFKIDLGKYRTFVDQLKENGIFDTFDKKTQGLLEDIDLVKDFLVAGGDAGTSLEAAALAEQAKGALSGRNDMLALVRPLLEIFSLGKIFTNPLTRGLILGTGKEKLKPSTVNKAIGAIGATLLAPDDKGISDFSGVLNILPGVSGIGEDEKEVGMMAPTPNVSFNPIPESRLASVVNPVGMQGAPTADTGAMNPNTMARGQQLFGGPGEITFAAKGGIMNTKKAFQRVA
jgi:tetratricopeptide (TPR) repeat protein